VAKKIKQCWINQPSTAQPLHKQDGKNVLVAFDHDGYPTVIYFLDKAASIAGDFRLCLADGWKA
jgi:hypothetical protein